MRIGQTVGGRYAIEEVAGAGGIGAVYRARDSRTGEPVAIKVLRAAGGVDGTERSRFEREATLLAALRHPGIVRYVAHGFLDDGRRFLAMEWVDGRTLAQALASGPLDPADALAIVTQAAHALGAAHAAGVVHRDVKPSNLMLLGEPHTRGAGRLEHPVVKLIDFGLAVAGVGDATLTAAGRIVGTPGYMSPEQARGRSTDARADVFALGCVLYRCLAGEAPFPGDDVLAILTKTILVEPPSLAQLGLRIADDLDALVERMLSKDRALRPAHGLEVATRLAAIGAPSSGRVARKRLADAERRLVCLVLVRAGHGAEVADPPFGDVAAPGARVLPLLDGSVAAVFAAGAEAATDVAARAARWALAVADLGRADGVALVATRVEPDAFEDLAAPVERAAALAHGPGRVVVDAEAASLLEGTFALSPSEGTTTLGPPLELAGRARLVGGRPTPFVGRAVELEQIASSAAASVEERVARAVVVTGPEGIGKSRLRHEVVAQLGAEPGRSAARAQLWTARADPWSSDAAYSLASRVLACAAGADAAAAAPVRRERLAERVGRCLPESDRNRVARFLGVIAGLGLEGDDIEARASREDPVVCGDQVRRAWEDWIVAEAALHPLLVVVDDAHCADAPSLRLLDAALREASERPFFLLVFARPLLEDRFPRLFSERRPEHVRLRPLGKRSSERIAASVLGDSAETAVVTAMSERAAGNPFLLEELLRAELRGDERASFPPTAVAMAEARIVRLEAADRRLLRAASVLGDAFGIDALASVLEAEEAERQTLPVRLAGLVDAEVLILGQRRAASEPDLVFAHPLLREAAYAMLTDRDRAEAHTRAARWLESREGTDAAVLANHFERGGVPERATRHYAGAAERALGGNDLDGALELVARGLACAERAGLAAGPHVARLSLVAAEAHRWRGDFASAADAALHVGTAAPGSDADADAIGELASVAGALGHLDALWVRAGALADAATTLGVAHACALARAASQLLLGGASDRARRLLDAVDRRVTEPVRADPRVRARLRQASSIEAFLRGDTVGYLESANAAAVAFETAGDLRNGCLQRGNVGHAHVELGDLEGAERDLRSVATTAERLGLANIAAVARSNLAQALGRTGRVDEAIAIGQAALARFTAQGDRRLAAATLAQIAEALTLSGRHDEATVYAERARERAEGLPPMQALALSMLARARLARGEIALAVDAGALAVAAFRAAGVEGSDVLVLGTYGDALRGAGRLEEARSVVEEALERLRERASRLPAAMLGGYVERVPENATLVRLARQLGLPVRVGDGAHASTG